MSKNQLQETIERAIAQSQEEKTITDFEVTESLVISPTQELTPDQLASKAIHALIAKREQRADKPSRAYNRFSVVYTDPNGAFRYIGATVKTDADQTAVIVRWQMTPKDSKPIAIRSYVFVARGEHWIICDPSFNGEKVTTIKGKPYNAPTMRDIFGDDHKMGYAAKSGFTLRDDWQKFAKHLVGLV